MTEYQIKDSGEREIFNTGSRRDTRVNKGRYDLISFIALERLAIWYELGAAKYGDNNYRLGQPLMRYVDSAMRHLIKWVMGWKDEDHASAAAWNLFAIIETEEMIRRGKLPKELDDRWEPFLDDYEWKNKKETPFKEVCHYCHKPYDGFVFIGMDGKVYCDEHCYNREVERYKETQKSVDPEDVSFCDFCNAEIKSGRRGTGILYGAQLDFCDIYCFTDYVESNVKETTNV